MGDRLLFMERTRDENRIIRFNLGRSQSCDSDSHARIRSLSLIERKTLSFVGKASFLLFREGLNSKQRESD